MFCNVRTLVSNQFFAKGTGEIYALGTTQVTSMQATKKVKLTTTFGLGRQYVFLLTSLTAGGGPCYLIQINHELKLFKN